MERKTVSFNAQKYAELLVAAIPRVIETDAEYDRIEPIFERLLDKGVKRSPEEDSLFDLLTNLMESYERRKLEFIEPFEPVELLSSLMKANRLKQKDLAEICGGQPIVSDILNGKREINKEQAKRLGEYFAISPAAFLFGGVGLAK